MAAEGVNQSYSPQLELENDTNIRIQNENARRLSHLPENPYSLPFPVCDDTANANGFISTSFKRARTTRDGLFSRTSLALCGLVDEIRELKTMIESVEEDHLFFGAHMEIYCDMRVTNTDDFE